MQIQWNASELGTKNLMKKQRMTPESKKEKKSQRMRSQVGVGNWNIIKVGLLINVQENRFRKCSQNFSPSSHRGDCENHLFDTCT